jgi:non-ribosomal peptide synthetase component F
MVPSVLHYLKQYFDEINITSMRYNLFCGEALPLDVTEEWSRCLPNADIFNVYGPTENTIFFTSYKFIRNSNNKEHNGILSIGKPMEGVKTVIVDENNKILQQGEKGELCLAGKLLTPGYWKNNTKNKEAFFTANYLKEPTRFFKTGDLCYKDREGDIFYLGRIDFQVKIQGYRIELTEIEYHAREYLEGQNAVAVAFENKTGNLEIALFVEGELTDSSALSEYLKSKIPYYMIPSKILLNKQFPLNSNGKINRIKLINQLT